jgi:hypothetical protein
MESISSGKRFECWSKLSLRESPFERESAISPEATERAEPPLFSSMRRIRMGSSPAFRLRDKVLQKFSKAVALSWEENKRNLFSDNVLQGS